MPRIKRSETAEAYILKQLNIFRRGYLAGEKNYRVWNFGPIEAAVDPAQALALYLKPRIKDHFDIVMLVAGQGAGKSMFIPRWLLRQAILWRHKYESEGKKPAFTGLLGAPGGDMFRQIFAGGGKLEESGLMRYAKFELRQANMTQAVLRLDKRIHPNGVILTRHLAQGSAKAQGRHLHAAAVDEIDLAGRKDDEITYETFKQAIWDRTARYGRHILFGTTPYKFDWVYNHVYMRSWQVRFDIYFENSAGKQISYYDFMERPGGALDLMGAIKEEQDIKAQEHLKKMLKEWKKRWVARLVRKGSDLFLSIIYPNILPDHYDFMSHIDDYYEARKDGRVEEFQKFKLARWVPSGKLFFREFVNSIEDYRLEEDDFDEFYFKHTGQQVPHPIPVNVGVDFGYGDSPHALAFVAPLEGGIYYIVADWEGYESVSDVAGRIVATATKYNLDIRKIYIDTTVAFYASRFSVKHREERSMLEDFKSAIDELLGDPSGLIEVGNAPRRISYDRLKSISATGKLYIHPRALKVLAEISSAGTDVFSNSRQAHSYHALDAVRYAVYYKIQEEEQEKRLNEFKRAIGQKATRTRKDTDKGLRGIIRKAG